MQGAILSAVISANDYQGILGPAVLRESPAAGNGDFAEAVSALVEHIADRLFNVEDDVELEEALEGLLVTKSTRSLSAPLFEISEPSGIL
jgi:hypothetical protein